MARLLREEQPARIGVPMNFKALLSTRRMARTLGVHYGRDDECRFDGCHNRSPSASFIPILAMKYMRSVIIPNALFAVKNGVEPGDLWMPALDYCMTTRKSKESAARWETEKADGDTLAEARRIYEYYVHGKMDDGGIMKKRYCFDGYLNKTMPDKFEIRSVPRKKTNAELAVDELLKRMETEAGLKTASRRDLIKLGIPERTANLFLKARKAITHKPKDKKNGNTTNSINTTNPGESDRTACEYQRESDRRLLGWEGGV